MKGTRFFAFSLAVFVLAGTVVLAQEKKNQAQDNKQDKPKEQKECPKGHRVDKKYYFDFNGKRIYSCGHKECMDKIKADPAGCLKKFEEQGILPTSDPNPDDKKGKDKKKK